LPGQLPSNIPKEKTKIAENSSTEAEGPPADAFAEAAEAFIQDKAIGERIRYLRQRKGMGLVELGRHTGLSASFLSQLETGRVIPTLRNLARIALVFSRDMSFFFEPEQEELFRIVRHGERPRLPQSGADVPSYFFESLGAVPNGSQIVPYIAEFLPADGKKPQHQHQHAGAEFLYVLSGTLQVTHGDRTETFATGDALYFHSSTTHSYQRLGDDPCTAIVLAIPTPAKDKPRSSH
jgi:transcriptional regulator with XRE-family HTH domain